MSKVLDIEVKPTDSAREAVLGADIVICATTSKTPVIESSWLAAGVHINTVGPKFKSEHELGIDVAERAALIATDSLDQISAYSKPFFLKDIPNISKIVELADVITGNHPGRTSGEMISLFCSVGLAGTEVLVANELFESVSHNGS
jgi:ornithine cyclodeaminase